MQRRDFGRLCVGALGAAAAGNSPLAADAPAASADAAGAFPNVAGLTAYVAGFVVNTSYEAIPASVIELGKKSILDGFGLALASTRADSGGICLS
jgi:hypothetical protein